MLDLINKNSGMETSLHFDSFQFKEELRNSFFLHCIDPTEPGNWEYEGKWYFNKTDLYIAVLAYNACKQFGITDVGALIAIMSGQTLISTRGKFNEATKGTSYASKYLSKIRIKSPIKLPSITGYPKIIGGKGLRVTFTKIIGRFLGRAVPIIGWGILAYDISIIFYDTQIEFDTIIGNEN